jgi:hypothetical protein
MNFFLLVAKSRSGAAKSAILDNPGSRGNLNGTLPGIKHPGRGGVKSRHSSFYSITETG